MSDSPMVGSRLETLAKQMLTFLGVVATAISVPLVGYHAIVGGHVAAVLPQPKVVSPVTLKVIGSQTVIAGVPTYLHLDITGEHGTPDWKLLPDVAGGLTVEANGMRAKFQTEEPNAYIVIVSVAGPERYVVSDVLHIAALDGRSLTEQPVEPEPVVEVDRTPPPMPPQLMAQAVAPVEPALVDVAYELAKEVESEQRSVEAKKISGLILAVIGRLDSGLIAPDADPISICEQETTLALGDKAEPWRLFYDQVRSVFAALKGAGRVTTAASHAEPLREISKALKRVQ
jgi:hypothetical protein